MKNKFKQIWNDWERYSGYSQSAPGQRVSDRQCQLAQADAISKYCLNNSDKKGTVDSTSTQREAQQFRETNCKGNVLYKDAENDNVSIDQVEKMFPTVRFTNDKCNPPHVNLAFLNLGNN